MWVWPETILDKVIVGAFLPLTKVVGCFIPVINLEKKALHFVSSSLRLQIPLKNINRRVLEKAERRGDPRPRLRSRAPRKINRSEN